MIYEYLNLVNTMLLILTMFFIMYFIIMYQKQEKKKDRQERLRFTQLAVEKIENKIESYTLKNKISDINNKFYYINNYLSDNDEFQIFLLNLVGDFKKICDGIIYDIYDEEYIKIYLSDTIANIYNITSKNINFKSNEDVYSIQMMLKKWSKV